jgi:hypothetical protein
VETAGEGKNSVASDSTFFRKMSMSAPLKWSAAILIACGIAIVVWFLPAKEKEELPKKEELPREIALALERLPGMPEGTNVEEAFRLLGFTLPYDAMDKTIQGRTGMGWLRYEIGFGKEFVLECETRKSKVPLETPTVLSVEIRKLKPGSGNRKDYETLLPVWKDSRVAR